MTISGALSAGRNAVSIRIAEANHGTLTLDNTIIAGTISVVAGTLSNTTNGTFDINQTGQSINTLTGSSMGTNTLEGSTGTGVWFITGDNQGTMTNGAANISFTNIQNLIGNTGVDQFTFTGAFQLAGTTGIDGELGSNTLTSPDVDASWSIAGSDRGTIEPLGSTGPTNFMNIPILTGGCMNDTFSFANSASVTGAIDGGSTGSPPTNTIDYTNFPTATVNFNAATESGIASNITRGFTQIQSVIGLSPSSPASFSSTSPIAIQAIFLNATASSGFFDSIRLGTVGFSGLMGPAADNVISLVGLLIQLPSLILDVDDENQTP